MKLMRDLDDKYKISVRAIAEVDDALNDLVGTVRNKLRWKTHDERPSKPGRASCVCAMILWLDGLPEAQKRQILAEGHRELDRLLAFDDADEKPYVSDEITMKVDRGGGEPGFEARPSGAPEAGAPEKDDEDATTRGEATPTKKVKRPTPTRRSKGAG